MDSALALKADRKDIEYLDGLKADKTLVYENIAALNMVFKQLEQSVILLVESLRNLVPTPNKSENAVNSTYSYLLKQASALLKWINSKRQDEGLFENLNLGNFLC